jgi:hypothetical protein
MRAVRLAVSALLALVAVATAGCGGSKSAATTTVTTVQSVTNPTGTASVTTHGRYHYPAVVVNNFMQSCTNGKPNRKAYCGCTLDKLSNNVSVQDFARIGLSGGKVPPRINRVIQKAAVDCADKL